MVDEKEQKKALDVMVFTVPLSQYLDSEKRRSIKILMDLLDTNFSENTKEKLRYRKAILDEVNNNFRMFISLLERVAKRKVEAAK